MPSAAIQFKSVKLGEVGIAEKLPCDVCDLIASRSSEETLSFCLVLQKDSKQCLLLAQGRKEQTQEFFYK